MASPPLFNAIEIAIKKTLIDDHPFFSVFNSTQKGKFIELANQYSYLASQIVFHQYDEIDAIYIIVTGDVEIAIQESPRHPPSLQCILSTGDAIGIGEADFFSTTGLRSATLTCISDVVLIGWPIDTFINLIRTYSPNTDTPNRSMQLSELMLRIYFIKKIAFFSPVSAKKIAVLAEKMTQLQGKVGDILFSEGEKGNECYLIEEGQVEILIKDKHGQHYQAAILKKQDFFGELALLSDLPRNATARVLEECRLLVIQKMEFHALISSNYQAAERITSQAIERVRPVRNLEVKHYHRTNPDGETITILKNTQLKRYYQLSPIGWYIWKQLDGTETIENIVMKVFYEFKLFSIETATHLIFNFIDQGFATIPIMPLSAPLASNQIETSKWKKMRNVFINYLTLRKTFKNLDECITNSYQRFFHIFFSKISFVMCSAIALSGFICFILTAQRAIFLLPEVTHPVIFFILLIALHYALSLFHELGHAYTVKFFNHEVHQAGIVFYWLGLFAYVDTSDMWLSDNASRVQVNLAGMYVDLVLAGLFSIAVYLLLPAPMSLFFWLTGLLLYVSVLINLNPLNEGDGYQAIVHAFHAPKLRCDASMFLKDNQFAIKNTKGIKQNIPSLVFWFISFSVLILNLLLAVAGAYYINLIFSPTLFYLPTYYLYGIFPSVILIYFFRKVKM